MLHSPIEILLLLVVCGSVFFAEYRWPRLVTWIVKASAVAVLLLRMISSVASAIGTEWIGSITPFLLHALLVPFVSIAVMVGSYNLPMWGKVLLKLNAVIVFAFWLMYAIFIIPHVLSYF